MPFNSKLLNFVATWNEVGGVYGITNANSQLIYIGSTDNFKRRMSEHQNDRYHLMHKYSPVYAYAEVISDPTLRLRREQELISEYRPPCNQKLG